MSAPTRKKELGTLFTAARSNNKARGITGALLLSGDWFVQVLEGEDDRERDELRAVMRAALRTATPTG